MDKITNALGRAGNYLATMGISDFIDIIIVAYLIYRIIWFIRKSSFINLAKGLILVLVALWASEFFGLIMLSYILRKTVELGVIALVILFQPELRRLLERMGSTLNTNIGGSSTDMTRAISEVAQACGDMAATNTGALLVFERKVSLLPIVGTGSVVNADTNAELIKNLFFKNAPLHDGAVIMRDARIEAAGCVLPLSKNQNLSRDLGTRHRAGLGVSEESDAIAVIVSEERGDISAAIDGQLKRHLSPGQLAAFLTKELIHEEKKDDKAGLWKEIKNFFQATDDDSEDAHETKSE
ncbi:MAG: diadenylate cyclase CdaA [Oscillospiraceae bacterium]|nr:diadenylate cyclase CdaA [Oscillospiraceae bacterium]